MLDSIASINYRITLSQSFSGSTFLLQFVSCFADQQGIVLHRAESWPCALPEPSFIASADSGYSEAKGIVGGISDRLQAAQSIVIERAISDALIFAVCEVVDKSLAEIVLLRGPAFPKTLGRLLSLRFPERMVLAWLTPLQPPEEAADETDILLRRLVKTEIRLLSFQHDYLLRSFNYPENKPTHLVEFVDNGDSLLKQSRLVELLDSDFQYCRTRLTRYLDFAEFGIPPAKVTRYVMKAKQPPSWLDAKEAPGFVQSKRMIAQGGFIYPWNTTAEPNDTDGVKK